MSLPPFQRLVDEHWRDVARLTTALAGAEDAEDVAQQAWLQALTAYPALRSAANLRGWLMTVAARCAIDAHRSRARRPTPVAEVPERVAPSPADGGPGPTGDPALWAAVRALPERQRLALALRYVADLDHAQVARALGTTPAASRRLVSDALAALRRHPAAGAAGPHRDPTPDGGATPRPGEERR